ncbi:MAG: hypothetical protein SFV24_18990 [Gemmatimonadales bacterium]|nr:hypothetical protein [Gemmatimonadales bacterium]
MGNFDDLDALLKEEMGKRAKRTAKPAALPSKPVTKATAFQTPRPRVPMFFDADRFRWLYHPTKGSARRADFEARLIDARVSSIDTARRILDSLMLKEQEDAETP